MLISFFRIIILYVLVLFAIRVLGKRQISQFQPFELVITIMIADIATEPLSDVNVPLLNGIIPLIVFIFLQTFISFLTYKWEPLRKIICGKPSALVNDGILMQKNMGDMLIGIDDLCELLRNNAANNGVLDINEISYLILESNGIASFINKKDKGIVVSLIKYGKRIKANFSLANITQEKLDEDLQKRNIKQDKEVFWAYVYNKKIYIIRKDDFK